MIVKRGVRLKGIKEASKCFALTKNPIVTSTRPGTLGYIAEWFRTEGGEKLGLRRRTKRGIRQRVRTTQALVVAQKKKYRERTRGES